MEADDIAQLDQSIQQLRMQYDKYFMGVERLEPIHERDQIKKQLKRLLSQPYDSQNKAVQKFRLQSLVAKLSSLETYWNRITRQIEEGTFKRDRLRAASILDKKPEEHSQTKAQEPKHTSPTHSDPLAHLYATYEATRQQLASHAPKIAFEDFAKIIDQQTKAIKAKFNCESVDFVVGVKNGKPQLKARPKTM